MATFPTFKEFSKMGTSEQRAVVRQMNKIYNQRVRRAEQKGFELTAESMIHSDEMIKGHYRLTDDTSKDYMRLKHSLNSDIYTKTGVEKRLKKLGYTGSVETFETNWSGIMKDAMGILNRTDIRFTYEEKKSVVNEFLKKKGTFNELFNDTYDTLNELSDYMSQQDVTLSDVKHYVQHKLK